MLIDRFVLFLPIQLGYSYRSCTYVKPIFSVLIATKVSLSIFSYMNICEKPS